MSTLGVVSGLQNIMKLYIGNPEREISDMRVWNYKAQCKFWGTSSQVEFEVEVKRKIWENERNILSVQPLEVIF